MSASQEKVMVVPGICPHTTGGLAFQEPAPIHQCVFVPSNLHTVESRQAAFSFVASIEKGCGSCSNVILHGGREGVEVIWSGCGNVQGPIIDRALRGLTVKNLDLVNENGGSAHIFLVTNTSLQEVKSRFEAVYSS